MRQYGIDLDWKISELCAVYKRYLSINDDKVLNVIIQDNYISIKMFSGINLIDQFEIKFNKNEKDIYMYISILLVKLLFDNKKIFNGKNVVYNDLHNYNISFEILDNNILDSVIMSIDKGNIDKIYEVVSDKLGWRLYPRKFMNNLDKRISLSRKLLRMGDE